MVYPVTISLGQEGPGIELTGIPTRCCAESWLDDFYCMPNESTNHRHKGRDFSCCVRNSGSYKAHDNIGYECTCGARNGNDLSGA